MKLSPQGFRYALLWLNRTLDEIYIGLSARVAESPWLTVIPAIFVLLIVWACYWIAYPLCLLIVLVTARPIWGLSLFGIPILILLGARGSGILSSGTEEVSSSSAILPSQVCLLNETVPLNKDTLSPSTTGTPPEGASEFRPVGEPLPSIEPPSVGSSRCPRAPGGYGGLDNVWTRETARPAGVITARLTSRVRNREPIDSLGPRIRASHLDRGRVFFFTDLWGMTGQTVTHIWKYEGERVSSRRFHVNGPCWRDWSVTGRLTKERVGEWQVSVQDSGGREIFRGSFWIVGP